MAEPVAGTGEGGYLMPGEVAAILHVDANTLARWANDGRITAVRTPGGHRRYLASEVRALAAHGFPAAEDVDGNGGAEPLASRRSAPRPDAPGA